MKTILLLTFVLIGTSSCSLGSGFRYQPDLPAIAVRT